MKELLIYGETAAWITLVVLVVVGIIKVCVPKVKDWWTRLAAAIASFAITIIHTYAANYPGPGKPTAQLVEEIFIVGILAFGSSQGVASSVLAATKKKLNAETLRSMSRTNEENSEG